MSTARFDSDPALCVLLAGVISYRPPLQVPDESGLSSYYWVDLTSDGDDVLELAMNLGGLEGGGESNGGQHQQQQQRVNLKVCLSVCLLARSFICFIIFLRLFICLVSLIYTRLLHC